MPAFQLTETEPRRGCRTIEVVGELDLAVADRLTEALNRAAEYPLVLVDLGNCDFVDSTGLAAFVHAHNSMKSEGRRFAIFGADHQVLRILSVTGLIEHDLVFESLEAALEAIAPRHSALVPPRRPGVCLQGQLEVPETGARPQGQGVGKSSYRGSVACWHVSLGYV